MGRVGYRRLIKGHITVFHAADTIRRIREDDKLDWNDLPKIVSFLAGEAMLWGPDFLDWKKAPLKPLYIIDGLIILGGVVSYAIGGEEGVYNYLDLITGDVSPAKFYDVVAPAVSTAVSKEITRIKSFKDFLWYIAERQLKRTGFNPNYPFMI